MPGAMPAILFLHGAGQDHSCWFLQSHGVERHGFIALAPDLPGHGQSEGEAYSSILALADWARDLLDALGLARTIVVGHSMGSLVALEFAARNPGRARQIALVGTALPMKVAPVLLDAARNDDPGAIDMVNTWSYGSGHGAAPQGMWLARLNTQVMARQPKGTFYRDLCACQTYARPLESMAALDMPTLFLTGSEDRMASPKVAGEMQAMMPNARQALIPGGGHMLMAEYPDAVLDALGCFIAP